MILFDVSGLAFRAPVDLPAGRAPAGSSGPPPNEGLIHPRKTLLLYLDMGSWDKLTSYKPPEAGATTQGLIIDPKRLNTLNDLMIYGGGTN